MERVIRALVVVAELGMVAWAGKGTEMEMGVEEAGEPGVEVEVEVMAVRAQEVRVREVQDMEMAEVEMEVGMTGMVVEEVGLVMEARAKAAVEMAAVGVVMAAEIAAQEGVGEAAEAVGAREAMGVRRAVVMGMVGWAVVEAQVVAVVGLGNVGCKAVKSKEDGERHMQRAQDQSESARTVNQAVMK